MRKRDKLYYKNRRQPSPEKSHKLKSLKHLIQSLSRKAYWDYVDDLITPKDEHYKNRRQPSPEKSHKLKSLKHLIQSLSRKAYWDYVDDLITPKDEHSPEEKISISKKFYTFIKHKKTDSTGIKTLKKKTKS